MLRGAYKILDEVEKHLNIKVGETTKDGKFTLVEVECLGACSNAPMFAVNDDFYVCGILHRALIISLGAQEDLTTETMKKVLDGFKSGTKPKVGPQSGRHTSENSSGLTALTSKVRPPR